MSSQHHHHHESSHATAHGGAHPRRRLIAALVLTAVFMVVEVLAGLWSDAARGHCDPGRGIHLAAPNDLDLLMARLADGDRSVFTAVFQALWSPILKVCTAMLKNEADAKDAAQDAMEKILARASGYDRSRPALPWALAIGAWECRTVAQRRRRRHEVAEEAAPALAEPSGEHDLIQRNLMVAALQAMDELSDSDRETLVAIFWNEAATVQGPTLRKRRERALMRLRATFRKLYGLD